MGFFSYFCSRKRITDYTERYLKCILRYTKYAISHLSVGHELEYGKQHGDFVVDGRYTFEVGGAGKNFKQIADIPNSFILADDTDYPFGNKLPLWLIGFLY